MKFIDYIDTQEQARHLEVEVLLNEIHALQEEYDKLLEKYVKLTALQMKAEEKALVVVKPHIGFDVGGEDEKD